MILDLDRFVSDGQPRWRELERLLDRVELQRGRRLEGFALAELERFFELQQRAAADLARLATFAVAPDVRGYLEALVARAYAETHDRHHRVAARFAPAALATALPRAFRRHLRAFAVAVAATLLGAVFGAGAVALDPRAKEVLMPFPHLLLDPAERVAIEESADEDRLNGAKATFSATLMTHNTRVATLALALGMTLGVGTLIVLFANGVLLGAVVLDYVAAGEGAFLAGWLLPHGSIEIPALLVAGQAGLVLGACLVGRDDPAPLRERLRRRRGDLVTLVVGVAALLVWAGIVESFVSQVHAPRLPYAVKIAFGVVELAALALYLAYAGRGAAAPGADCDRGEPA